MGSNSAIHDLAGEKEGRVGVGPPNINDWKFTIPTIEYRNMTWTYLDLVKAIRKDCIRSVLTQIPRQLIGESFFCDRKLGLNIYLHAF